MNNQASVIETPHSSEHEKVIDQDFIVSNRHSCTRPVLLRGGDASVVSNGGCGVVPQWIPSFTSDSARANSSPSARVATPTRVT